MYFTFTSPVLFIFKSKSECQNLLVNDYILLCILQLVQSEFWKSMFRMVNAKVSCWNIALNVKCKFYLDVLLNVGYNWLEHLPRNAQFPSIFMKKYIHVCCIPYSLDFKSEFSLFGWNLTVLIPSFHHKICKLTLQNRLFFYLIQRKISVIW